MTYHQAISGDWLTPKMRHKVMCCDCGLVHQLTVKVVDWGRGHRLLMKMERDERATAAARRAKEN